MSIVSWVCRNLFQGNLIIVIRWAAFIVTVLIIMRHLLRYISFIDTGRYNLFRTITESSGTVISLQVSPVQWSSLYASRNIDNIIKCLLTRFNSIMPSNCKVGCCSKSIKISSNAAFIRPPEPGTDTISNSRSICITGFGSYHDPPLLPFSLQYIWTKSPGLTTFSETSFDREIFFGFRTAINCSCSSRVKSGSR